MCTNLSQDRQNWSTEVLGMSSVISTSDLRQLTHMLVALGSMYRPHLQHALRRERERESDHNLQHALRRERKI